tara:strand:- start:556 stop:954 length:399 start_codon:yes stop_codon:yes gene_type:complete
MKIGFINGCFDILHLGHIALFEFAKKQCDYLVVAIDSDDRVASNKGPNRPINTSTDREGMLRAIRYIDDVRVFSTDLQLTNLVKEIKPEIMIVGNDWEGKTVIGSEYAKQLKFFRKIDGYSSTKTIQNISNR